MQLYPRYLGVNILSFYGRGPLNFISLSILLRSRRPLFLVASSFFWWWWIVCLTREHCKGHAFVDLKVLMWNPPHHSFVRPWQTSSCDKAANTPLWIGNLHIHIITPRPRPPKDVDSNHGFEWNNNVATRTISSTERPDANRSDRSDLYYDSSRTGVCGYFAIDTVFYSSRFTE